MFEEVTETIAIPRLGDKAPSFEAVTTKGKLMLEDYRGKWLILFSHPSSFSPVCATELVGFQEIYPLLKDYGVEILGLSVDSLSAHLAWLRGIEASFNTSIEYPIIADKDQSVATKYGMIMPGESHTETSRAVFILDQEHVIRSIMYYPISTGRNMKELVRLVQALQTAQMHDVYTPANWEPGDKVLVAPPKTQDDMGGSSEEGVEQIDWYVGKKIL
ncbi:peroxiredoxin [Priestia koreensis]|uniref:peroxiredoxin n=1 Tax=Priestia koreensis TaxID=284581 RepID=UPI003459E123